MVRLVGLQGIWGILISLLLCQLSVGGGRADSSTMTWSQFPFLYLSPPPPSVCSYLRARPTPLDTNRTFRWRSNKMKEGDWNQKERARSSPCFKEGSERDGAFVKQVKAQSWISIRIDCTVVVRPSSFNFKKGVERDSKHREPELMSLWNFVFSLLLLAGGASRFKGWASSACVACHDGFSSCFPLTQHTYADGRKKNLFMAR